MKMRRRFVRRKGIGVPFLARKEEEKADETSLINDRNSLYTHFHENNVTATE